MEELLKGGLEKDQLYYIQVEAWADPQMKKNFSRKWQIGMQRPSDSRNRHKG